MRRLSFVYLALLGLLTATVATSFLSLGPGNLAISLAIALAKAALIATVFMHLARRSGLNVLAAAVAILWLTIMFALSFGDYFSR